MLIHDVIEKVSPVSMCGKPQECLITETSVNYRLGDIYLVTYPKTGTTLLQYICHLLRTGGDGDNFDDIHQIASPRLFKSHRTLQQVAPFGQGVRFIATIRDPTNTLYSLHDFREKRGQKQSSSLLEFAKSDTWTKENNEGCIFTLFDHMATFYQCKDCDNMLLIPYEDLVETPLEWLKIIHQYMYLGTDTPPLSDEVLQKIVFKTSREQMLLNVSKFNESWTAKERERLGRVNTNIGTKSASKVHSIEASPAENRSKLCISEEEQIEKIQNQLWKDKVLAVTGLSSYQAMRASIVSKHFPKVAVAIQQQPDSCDDDTQMTQITQHL